jgi:hypothetical protein
MREKREGRGRGKKDRSNTLTAMLHANEILLIDNLKFKIRFI